MSLLGTCFLDNSGIAVDCRSIPPIPARTALPTVQQYGNYSVEAVTGWLILDGQAITEIPAGGFDACPYTAATTLDLNYNNIKTVGARAFGRLAALTYLSLARNGITWMAPTSLDGLPLLEELYLNGNRLGAFDYGALVPMDSLQRLYLNNQEGGDLSCGGNDLWIDDPTGIAAAVALCGAAGSPCVDEAVACPACLIVAEPTHAETSNTIESMFGYYPVRYGVEFEDAVAAGYSRVFVVHDYTFYMQEDDNPQSYGTHVVNCTDCAMGACKYAAHVLVPGPRITQGAFHDCPYLETVTLSEYEVCSDALVGNVRLERVSGGPIVTDDPTTVLSNCFGYGLTGTGSYFTNDTIQCYPCAGKEELVVPESVTHIRTGAFKGCNKTRRVTIAGTVDTIDALAFEDTHSLERVEFAGDRPAEIDAMAFSACHGYGLEPSPESGSSIIECVPCSGGTVVIPDSVSRIDRGFETCPIEQITFPPSIAINGTAFGVPNPIHSVRLQNDTSFEDPLFSCDGYVVPSLASSGWTMCNCTPDESQCFDPAPTTTTIWTTRATTTQTAPAAALPTEQADTYGTSALTATLLAVLGCAVALVALAWRRRTNLYQRI